MKGKEGSIQPKLVYKVNVIIFLLITICTCAVAFLATHMYYKMIYTVLLFLLISVLGFFREGIKFIVAYAITFIWFMINIEYSINIPSPMLFTFLLTAIPILMAAFIMVQVPLGKTTVALRQLKVPEKLILLTIVTLRFIPTTLAESMDVKNAMKVRGFLATPLKIIVHPIKTFEYAVVPLVFTSLKIADELAASCIARGIESPKTKRGYYTNNMRFYDIFLGVFFVVISILFLV